MGVRGGLLFLALVVINWSYADARSLMTIYRIASESKVPEALKRNEQLCTMCEDFTAQATYFFAENKTQVDIMDALHQACSRLRSFELQCINLVDYYGSLFFKMISTVHPEEFCTKVNLCGERISISLPMNDDACTYCHQFVTEILTKLNDPDSQFEIIEVLLKECRKMDHYAQQCKKLVFRYGPLILANGEKFLETADVCASFHACSPSKAESIKPELLAEV